jgi:mannose-1-phosphate guanylyltransferase
MKNRFVVIMAGGVGSRYWPVSRVNHPKQFIDILGTGKSLLRQTYERFTEKFLPENIIVVTNLAYTDLVKAQIPELSSHQILAEPVARNTAPCIAYACYKIHSQNPKASVVIAPSDHLIMDSKQFHHVVKTGIDAAESMNGLITIGINPHRPDTGYGYIQFVEGKKGDKVFEVKTFTEKPNLELAHTFLASGDFLWNAGIFIWKASAIVKAFAHYLPEIHELFKKGDRYYNTYEEQDYIDTIYPKCASISIDYGILEKADNVSVVPGDFGWSDLGTWTSLYDIKDKDEKGNAVNGAQVHLYESHNNMVHVPDNRTLILKGANNLIVVEDGEVLLICDKDREQEIKQILGELKIRFVNRYQ